MNRAAALALVLAGCAAHGGASRGDPMERDWLDGGTVVGAEHLERVAALAQADPLDASLFAEARDRLGGGSVAGLAARFSTCPPSANGEPGLTNLACEHALLGLGLDDVAAGKPTSETQTRIAALLRAPARDVRVEQHPDYVFFERTSLPAICVAPRLSVAEAYEVVVHELVHALRYAPCRRTDDALGPADDATYMAAAVLAPGGEADAFVASIRARLRVSSQGWLISPLLDVFDRGTGNLIAPREALVPRILAPPPTGLGYATGRLATVRNDALAAVTMKLSLKNELFDKLLAQRRAAADVDRQNLHIHESNIEAARNNQAVYRARGDAKGVARWAAEEATAVRGLAATKAELEIATTSERRLVEEQAAVAAELAQLRGR